VRWLLIALSQLGGNGMWSSDPFGIHRRCWPCFMEKLYWQMHVFSVCNCRWGFVTHGCIDGYSRVITFLQTSTTNEAMPVLSDGHWWCTVFTVVNVRHTWQMLCSLSPPCLHGEDFVQPHLLTVQSRDYEPSLASVLSHTLVLLPGTVSQKQSETHRHTSIFASF